MNRGIAVVSVIALVALAASLTAQSQTDGRFDFKVRSDFFTGMSGNSAAFERAMKVCEETLAANPKHAEALVWHGGGLFFMSGREFMKGNVEKGLELYQRAVKEMDEAVRLAPRDVSVLIPRGSTYIGATWEMPPTPAKALLEIGVSDYEKTLEIQQPYFKDLSTHSRGELLLGLAGGWSRLGNTDKAKTYFERMARELPGSAYDKKARAWLANDPESRAQPFYNCTGCHVP